jgi:hypothetical protein
MARFDDACVDRSDGHFVDFVSGDRGEPIFGVVTLLDAPRRRSVVGGMAAQRLQRGVPFGRCGTLFRDLAFEKRRLTTSGSQRGVVLPYDRAQNGELRSLVVRQHGDEPQSVLSFGNAKQGHDAPLITDRG